MIMEKAAQIKDMPSSKIEYKCEKCKDTGWIETERDGYRFAAKCRCRLAREAEHRLEVSGLADTVQKQTFDSFITETQTQKSMKSTAQRYTKALLAAKKGDRIPWMYIGGNPGSGKTHICTAVCGEMLRNNYGVRYMQWLDESRKLKANVNDEDFEDQVADYINISVLYIDDLLKQKYTPNPVFSEADIKIAFTILNARYLMNKPTIISTEWSLLDHLLPADEGVFSRVYERCRGYHLNIDRSPANNFRLRRETA